MYASTLKLAALVAALATGATAKIAVGGALDPAHNHHAEVPSSDAAAASGPQPIHVHLQNKVGAPLNAVFVDAAGSPAWGKSQILHDSLDFTLPPHAAGQVTLGHNTNPAGSKLELSNGFQVSATEVYMDISYVDGFSVPIVCHCGSVTTGCSKPLFSQGHCPDTQPGPVCINNAPDNGPPEPFFAPCRNEAYVFSNQGGAGTGSYCPGNSISCCIGAACSGGKREVETVESDIAQRMAEARGLTDY